MEITEEGEEFSAQDQDKCVNEAIKAILILDHSKKPFKHTDIAAFLSQKLNRKTWNAVLDKAKEKLTEIGLTLVEIQNASTRTFILTSCNEPLPFMHRFAAESEVADRTLLTLVLTFIFMKEGRVTSEEIFTHLKHLNIYSDARPIHEYFGDIKKKILIDFVGQLYLEKVKPEEESDVIEIKWGERANAEVNKMSILQFVCEVGYEKTVTPKCMGSHYQRALGEEVVREEAKNEDDDVIIIDDE